MPDFWVPDMDKAGILKKIINDNYDEKLIIGKALDKAAAALKSFQSSFTDFFDPVRAAALKELLEKEVGKDNLKIALYAGFMEGERQMIGFFSCYDEVDYSAFPIECLEISFNEKYYSPPTHRDYLGSILGLGLTRERIGDIVLQEGRALCFVKSENADFICESLKRVGRASVNVKKITKEQICISTEPKEEISITVASLRLDVVLSGAFKLSRSKVSDLIENGRAFVNWKEIKSTSRPVSEGDIITLRGSGRIKLLEIGGVTKKGKTVIKVGIY